VAITKEIQIKTDGNAKREKSNHRALDAQIKTDGNAKRAKSHHASKGLFVRRESNKEWCHSYTDVMVVKDDLSYI
jgi:predicted ATPase